MVSGNGRRRGRRRKKPGCKHRWQLRNGFSWSNGCRQFSTAPLDSPPQRLAPFLVFSLFLYQSQYYYRFKRINVKAWMNMRLWEWECRKWWRIFEGNEVEEEELKRTERERANESWKLRIDSSYSLSLFFNN